MSKLLFVVNPKSGSGGKDKIMKEVLRYLSESAEYEIVYTCAPGHATSIAKDSDAEIIVAVGGDGTVNEVARGIIGTGKAMAIIPCGSGNGLALHLLGSRKIKKCVNILNRRRVMPIDCGMVNNHLFCCTCGVGMDAIVAHEFSHGHGRGFVNYIRQSIKILGNVCARDYKIMIDDMDMSRSLCMITVGNANQWGNNAIIAPLAELSDGQFDIACVSPFRFFDVPKLFIQLMKGNLMDSSKVEYYRGESIRIKNDSEMLIHCDGEPYTVTGDINISILKNQLNVVA